MRETSRAPVGWRFILVLGYRGYPSYSLHFPLAHPQGNSLGRGMEKKNKIDDHQLTTWGRLPPKKLWEIQAAKRWNTLILNKKTSKIVPGQVPADV